MSTDNNNRPIDTPSPSRARTRGRDQDADGNKYYSSSTLRSRAGARTREEFFDPAIPDMIGEAVDEALRQLGGSRNYRRAWCFYCSRLNVNTFLEEMFSVMSGYRQGEIREPAKAFHARLRSIMDEMDRRAATACTGRAPTPRMKGGAK